MGGIARNSFARLLNDPATQTLSATDTSQVIWTRGGSAPEIAQVTVEQSTDSGTTWTTLGSATRMGSTPNWRLTGLNLPTNVQLRARGRSSGGDNNGSSGLIEQVASFSGLQPLGIDVTQTSQLYDGISHVAFGSTLVGSSAPLTFTITNPGNADLSNLVVTLDGTDSGDFMVSALSATSLPVGAGTSTFTVTFSPTASGAKTAALHIASNLTGTQNPFDIILTGTGLNNAPTISDVAIQTINEDENTGARAFAIGDVETAAASLTVSGSSSNTTLVPNGNIVFSGSGASRSVVVTPAANQFGSATITVTVSDGIATTSDTFVLTVNSVNDVPTISNLTDRTTNEDTSTGAIAFTVGDVETAAAALTVTRTSSNTTLVPTANIVLGGSGASRTVTVTPAAHQFGSATITVTVSDGSANAIDTFLLTVNAVNDAPTISNITDQSIGVNTLTNSLPFTLGDVETPVAALSVSGTSSNQALVPDGNLFFGGSGANRTVTVVPETNQFGTATISVSVSDGVLTVTDTFVVTVLGADIAVEQPFNSNLTDGGSKSFGNVAVGANSSLNFFIKNTGNANLTGLTISQDGPDAGMFTVTANPTAPVSGPNGTTAFTVRFAPTSVGLKTAALHIASNNPDESPFDITLTGGPPAEPEIAVERSGVNIADGGSVGFVTATVGSPADVVFTVRNTGSAPLALNGTPVVAVGGTDAALFSVISPPASAVGAGDSTTFIVRYAPLDSSPKTATLSLANNDTDEHPFDLNLTGAVLSFTTDTDG
ncbi:MAG: choice-of-anchor D domain-containing protein, partial [Ramlibacter sp.]|uniref:beta strand repeat-containing protein n=1 Tax=Ramlibacter sp. TaxID=1917967 RepID=UPI00261F0179